MPNSEGKKRPVRQDKTAQKRKRKPEYTRVNAAGVESMKGSESTQEEKYRMLVQNIPCAVYSAYPGKAGPTTFISDKWKDWTGYSSEELYHDPEAWSICIHPDDREHAVNTYIEACRDGTSYNLEYRVVHKDTGKLCYVRDQGHLSKDKKGAVVRVDGIVTDITELKNANNELDKYRDRLEELVKKRTAELTSAYETLKVENKERKRAEQTLRKVEREKTTVLENLSDLIVYRDLDLVTLWASKSMAHWHGMSQDEIVGRICYKARYGREELCEKCHIVDAMKSGQRQELEKQLPDERFWHVTVNPVFSDSGQVIGTIEVSQDITDRKKADQALRQSEEKYRKLFEGAQDGIVLADAETGIIVDCNRAITEMLERDESELVGRHQSMIHPLDRIDRGYSVSFRKHLLQSEGPVMEEKVITSTGRIRDVVIKAKHVQLGDKKLLQGVFHDITERKRAGDELKKSKDILEKTFASLDSALFILDAKDSPVIIDCNPAATIIFGYEKQEMLGKTTEFLHVSKETLREFQKTLNRSIQDQGGLSFFEYKMQRKDGEVFQGEHSVRLLKDDNGLIIGWISVIRDITERKQSEEALRETTGLLETIFGHTHMLVACLDQQFNYIRVNSAYADADEREPSFFPGKNHFVLYPNEENETIFRRVVETGVPYLAYAKPFEYAEHPERGISYWDWGLVPIKNQQGIVSGLVMTLADVTARKHAEEALKESEDKLNAMLQSISDHMSMMDEDLNIIWANDMAKRMFGDDIVGKKCYEVYHGRKDPCEPYPCLTLKAFQDGKIHEHDTQVIDKDGKCRYFHCSANMALRDEQGKPIAVLEISKDITDQKLAEEALRESKNSYRAVVENTAEGIVVVQGQMLQFVNPAALSMFGYSREELLTRPFIEFIHPDHKEWAMGIHIKRLKGEEVPPVYELKVLDKKGNTIWVENNGILIEWRDKPATLNFLRDVTERKKAEQAIWASESEKRSILNAISDHIVFHDTDLLIRWSNEAAAKSIGMTQRELIGRYCYELWQGRSEPCERCPVIRAIETGSHTQAIMTTPDGKCWEIIGEPVLDRNGEIRGAIEICRDITERVLAEQALQESEERFRAIYENALVGLYRTTPDGRILMGNPALVQMMGYSSFEELEQLNLEEEGFSRDYQRSVFKQRVEAEDRIVGLESRWMKRDGTTLFVRESARTVRDKDGEILYYEGTVVDISDRKKAEEELRIREQKLRALLNAPTESAILVDTEGTILDINRIAAQRLGKSAESLIGMGIYDYLPTDIAEYRKAHGYEVVRSGKPVRFQDEREGCYYDTNIYPVFDDEGKVSSLAVFSGDITERKRAEQALRESEERLKILFESAPDAIYLIDSEGRFVDGNKAAEELIGFTKDEVIGKRLAEIGLLSTGQLSKAKANLKKTATDKLSGPNEYTLTKKDGSHVSVEVRAFPVKIGGKMLTLGIARDNTDRKQSQERILKSEIRYRELFNSMSSGVAVYEPIKKGADFVFKDINRAAERISMVRREDMAGRKVTEMFPTVAEFGLLDVFRRVNSTGKPEHHPVSLYEDDKLTAWYENFVYKLPSGEIVAVYDDVTEQKLVDQELEKQRYYLTKAQDMGRIGTWELDIGKNKLIWTDENYRIFGLDIGTELTYETFLHCVHPDDREYVDEKWKAALNNEPYDIEHRLIVDGEVKWVREKSDVQFDEKGCPVLAIGFAQDITERKRAEERVLEDRAQLKSLASELSLAEERERHRLATELHDQISQSLVISKIKLDQLRKSSASDELTKALEDICNCLGRIIDDTRTLTFDLSYPILYELGFEAAVSEWLADEIQEKHGIRTEFENDGQLKPLDEDIRMLLFRNVRELLVNIIKHAQAHKVKVSVRRVDGHIHVSVEDDGVGFDPVEMTSTAAQKAKFGLFSIRERLEQLGGMIEIDSRPGHGSKITMTAPLKNEDQTDRV